MIKEVGFWVVGINSIDNRVYIESSDFTHDARLYINGDFETCNQKITYAREIANRLNSYKEVK